MREKVRDVLAGSLARYMDDDHARQLADEQIDALALAERLVVSGTVRGLLEAAMASKINEIAGSIDWDEWPRALTDHALAALADAGLAVVPVEPTEEMIDAADAPEYHVTCERRFVRREIVREWRAMLAAALKP